jgi:FixJ family two-component response regulator
MTILRCASAEEFVAAERPPLPSCLVLDVRMPQMSGIELQQLLARVDPHIPIIFVTAHADVRLAVRAMKSGAVEFLAKPFEDQDLLDAVHQALARHERALETRRSTQEAVTRLERLSRREREVLVRVVAGMLNKQIGHELGITEKTVKAHRAKVMEKMGAESLPDLVRIAQRAGIHAEPL